MRRLLTVPVSVVLLVLVGCSRAPESLTGPDSYRSPALAAMAGGKTEFMYTLSGDVTSDVANAPGTARMASTKPFFNLSVSGVRVLLSVPTGNVASCRTGKGTYTSDFGANAETVWTGTLSIPTTGTMSFLGTNDVGATVQFSVSDATGGPVQILGATPGSYDYVYSDARFYFGSNSTIYDSLYRCVNITITATP